ncbi:MAG: hypothetical protein EOP14_00420 [Pseudomonas sp.]|nr:MAG: hypothetical protein EOP14_00420 [Pseudomonas sp.]
MIWALVLSASIGAICAVRLPIVIFTFISTVVVIGFMIIAALARLSALEVLGWAFLLSIALAAGCMITHLLLYALYVRGRRESEDKQSAPELDPRYTRD